MKIYTTLFSALFLTACAWPQTSGEFIKTMGKGNEIVVNTPYKTVVSRNTKLFNKCLHLKIKTSKGGTLTTYNPKIIPGKKLTVYSLQLKSHVGANTGYPDDGFYYFTGQVQKISKSRTKVTTHVIWNMSSKELETTFQDWSKGTSNICPDMT